MPRHRRARHRAAPTPVGRRGWWALLAASLGTVVVGSALATTSVAGPVDLALPIVAGPAPTTATAAPADPPAPRPTDPGPAPRAPDRTGPAPVPVRDATGGPPVARVDRPVQVLVPRIGLTAPVRPVGVDRRGAMALPSRPTELGWYRFGPSPGADGGATVLAGHVDSRRYGLGPLVRLQELRPGDRIRVGLASGAVIRYRVDEAASVAKRRLALDQLFRRDGPPALVLVTCGGSYDEDAGGYEDNIVVTAVPERPR